MTIFGGAAGTSISSGINTLMVGDQTMVMPDGTPIVAYQRRPIYTPLVIPTPAVINVRQAASTRMSFRNFYVTNSGASRHHSRMLKGTPRRAAGVTWSDFELVFTGFIYPKDANAKDKNILSVCIEYNGLIYRGFNFGNQGATLVGGANKVSFTGFARISDGAPLVIPQGTDFFEQNCYDNTGGVFDAPYDMVAGQLSEYAVFTTAATPDSAHIPAGQAGALTGMGGGGWGSSAIYAVPSDGQRQAIAIPGDSNASGIAGGETPGQLRRGYIERAIGNEFGFVKAAMAGSKCTDYIYAPNAQSLTSELRCTDLIWQPHANDVLNGGGAQTNLLLVRFKTALIQARDQGMRVHVLSPVPRAYPLGLNWSACTYADQIPDVAWPTVLAYHDYCRANPDNLITSYHDVYSPNGAPDWSGRWALFDGSGNRIPHTDTTTVGAARTGDGSHMGTGSLGGHYWASTGIDMSKIRRIVTS